MKNNSESFSSCLTDSMVAGLVVPAGMAKPECLAGLAEYEG